MASISFLLILMIVGFSLALPFYKNNKNYCPNNNCSPSRSQNPTASPTPNPCTQYTVNVTCNCTVPTPTLAPSFNPQPSLCQPGNLCNSNDDCIDGYECQASAGDPTRFCLVSPGGRCGSPIDCDASCADDILSCTPVSDLGISLCCNPPGLPCRDNRYCCSDNQCINGTCMMPPICLGAACQSSTDCCQGYECQLQGASSMGRCLVSPGGSCRNSSNPTQPCSGDLDCTRLSSSAISICCNSTGLSCVSDRQCCPSNRCFNGTCLSDYKASCVSTSQCYPNLICVSGVCDLALNFPSGIQVFDSPDLSYNFLSPPRSTLYIYELCGAGGAGGANGNDDNAGGGGAGACIFNQSISLSPSMSSLITIIVGAGGKGTDGNYYAATGMNGGFSSIIVDQQPRLIVYGGGGGSNLGGGSGSTGGPANGPIGGPPGGLFSVMGANGEQNNLDAQDSSILRGTTGIVFDSGSGGIVLRRRSISSNYTSGPSFFGYTAYYGGGGASALADGGDPRPGSGALCNGRLGSGGGAINSGTGCSGGDGFVRLELVTS